MSYAYLMTNQRKDRNLISDPNFPRYKNGLYDGDGDKKRNSSALINYWSLFAHLVTFWAPPFLLSRLGGFKERESRQAFREKIALCLLIFFLSLILAFFTFGLGFLICPNNINERDKISIGNLANLDPQKYFWHHGKVYGRDGLGSKIPNLPIGPANDRILLGETSAKKEDCQSLLGASNINPCLAAGNCVEENELGKAALIVTFYWADLRESELYVYNGNVFNASIIGDNFSNPRITKEHREFFKRLNGQDVTLPYIHAEKSTKSLIECLSRHAKVGNLNSQTLGCTINRTIQTIALSLIILLIFTKFIMATLFSWIISRRLERMSRKFHARSKNGNIFGFANHARSFPEIVKKAIGQSMGRLQVSSRFNFNYTNDPFVIMLVTCYSEGRNALRRTLDSLATADYVNKMLFIVVDGVVEAEIDSSSGAGNGTGNEQRSTTAELVREMMIIEKYQVEQSPKEYLAITDGHFRSNAAKVWAGHYCTGDGVVIVPCLLIVKCGNRREIFENHTKPGNRGKRDSQLILMKFMQKCLFNDRMSELDFDVFNKICWLMDMTPDVFEIVLMVDADTVVEEASITRMVMAMQSDPQVIGLCGETKIANKRDGWVSRIQVFEYYISHHLGKAFESVFGGVTCLPGCFCMYRLWLSSKFSISPSVRNSPKAGKPKIPLLVSPLIIDAYSQCVVDTLHKKNLFLLGEDRYLTTLMLKCFPLKKLIWVPQAICHTVVPNRFKVLLSQRRRWINSTVHNLLELMKVDGLCGIFCFSMQFVVAMELVGTVTLPAAIIFTIFLFIYAFFDFYGSLVPLVLLALILGLPAILIMITTRKFVYLGWMVVYLISLPIWNFVLPVYAFWHFDDFSWGHTRRHGHRTQSTSAGATQSLPRTRTESDESFKSNSKHSPKMKTWIEWIRSRQEVVENPAA